MQEIFSTTRVARACTTCAIRAAIGTRVATDGPAAVASKRRDPHAIRTRAALDRVRRRTRGRRRRRGRHGARDAHEDRPVQRARCTRAATPAPAGTGNAVRAHGDRRRPRSSFCGGEDNVRDALDARPFALSGPACGRPPRGTGNPPEPSCTEALPAGARTASRALLRPPMPHRLLAHRVLVAGLDRTRRQTGRLDGAPAVTSAASA